MKKTSTNNSEKLKIRVAKIKGQLNGLEKMLVNNIDCLEVFNQLAAIKGALTAMGRIIMEEEASCLGIYGKDKKKLKSTLDRFIKIN